MGLISSRARSPSADMTANPTLRGHKLLFLTASPSEAYLSHLRFRFPDLSILLPPQREKGADGKSLPPGEWEDVTVLLADPRLSGVPDEPSAAPRLQYVQVTSAGANSILERPIFKDTETVFCTANGVHGPQISEWVIASFLAHQHHFPFYLDRQHEERWQRGSLSVEDAVGRRVGILGYGSIGRQVARVAQAMGMDVHAYTLHAKDTPESRRDDAYTPPGIGDPDGVLPSRWFSGGSKADLHAFLASGLDLLVVSTPLTAATRGLLSADEFAVLAGSRGAFVSNIARGPVIDTAALIAALDGGLIRGAALDVTDPEPLPDGHPLWRARNIIITPHVSGASTSYNERVLAILEENLERLSQGRELVNAVSRREGY